MPCHYHSSRSIIFVLLLLWSLPVWAAPGLLILDNPLRRSFTGFASSLAVVGDIDGDGVSDYLVGAYEHYWQENLNQGRAFVFSGQSGKILWILDLPTPYQGAAFGSAVAAAGDVNQDGVPDLLVGAFGQGESGQAFVFSGKTGKLLYTMQAPRRQSGAGFGWAVTALGDLTGDGVPELVVGAFAQEGRGRVFVFDGQNGKLLRTLAPPSLSESMTFGWSVAAAGDLDQDGSPDILVGAPYTPVGELSVQGRVFAFSGRTGELLYALTDPFPRAGEGFGWRVASGGDLNGDGVPDILIGAPYKSGEGTRSEGAAFVFNGADGSLLFSLRNPALSKSYSGFGLMVAQTPDINGDGVPEILVSAPYQKVDLDHVQGEVFLFDGHDGRHLSTFDDPSPHQGATFGYAAVSPGDVNGDQIPDFAVGAAGQAIMDKVAVGRVYVFLSQSQRAEAAEEGRLRLGRTEEPHVGTRPLP
ncbi:MAG TPA: FG-GAP-like repeat-containing protein [Candidatus Binatia bacterium]|jgi:hypothetical protein|nr:FG-GAP-like repeat-containing protein [Candidatus Binatia bacterium]